MAAPASDNPAPTPANPELELKFVIGASMAPVLLAWLQATCTPHPDYPEARTSSVYFDTGDWRLLNEKVGSDYFKRKVRLRWYHPVEGASPSAPDPAFIEAKLKEGARRDKVRVVLPQPGRHWAETPLEDPQYTDALKHLTAEGFEEVGRLLPAFQIGYLRRRFVHPFTHSTLCLDTDIRVERVHHNRFRQHNPAPLSLAVIEQKSPLNRLDPLFADLTRYGIRKDAFSKYLHCYLHLQGTFL